MPGDPFFFVASLVVLVFSIVLHEVAHGRVAKAFGDPTAEEAGRLTLNPIPHLDPMLSLALPAVSLWASNGAIAFGSARPVPVNPLRLRPPSAGILVAAAGPATNVVLGLGAGLLWGVFLRTGVFDPEDAGTRVLRQATAMNFFLVAFNLLPIPPLDGSRVLGGLFPRTLGRVLGALEPYGFLILVALMFSRAFDGVFAATAGPATSGWLRLVERTIVRAG
ncbi:MAG TPA: site-2 protease family protein [Planctomycetota bacterium]|nr:site-2 protease family protein [Planctomycetota bacterium]